jgi:hypothetical protein
MTDFLTSPGTFAVGCNYWASHAGTNMWSDWNAQVVEDNFKQLSENGLQMLRIFPLWPDFQPIRQMYTGAGQPMEIRIGEAPLPDDEFGRAGIDPVMMERFHVFADLAEKYHLKLVVGLLTGWMSGRLFVPPALEKLNVLADPVALMWEVKFVRCFVRCFKDHPAVFAWDLGNECNCMGPVTDHATAYTWVANITGAIAREDPHHPIVSGMHSLDEPSKKSAWRTQDQHELLDILTTHPYPIFTPHCDQEPINTMRPLLHSTAQTRWYGDVGQMAAFCEETGSLGPMIASESVAADFLRTALLSLWAHDCRGLLWWCAYDQKHLTHAPYDWHGWERELGLFRVGPDGQNPPKPNAAVMREFRAFVDGLPFPALPARVVDAVCILTEDQEQWAAAYSSFILAKQAGLEIEFQYADQPLREARAYFVPSASGGGSMQRHVWMELMEKVHAGAVLYLSSKDAVISPFNEVFGLEVNGRQRRSAPAEFRLSEDGAPVLSVPAPIRLNLNLKGAQALAQEADGSPVFTRGRYGQGWAYFLGAPLETALAEVPGAFDDPQGQPYWKIYSLVAQSLPETHVVKKDQPRVGVTEHPLDNNQRVVVAVNYHPQPANVALSLAPGWQVANTLRGEPLAQAGKAWQCQLPANDGAVWIIKKV